MKIGILVIAAFFALSAAESDKLYRAEDKEGNLILETGDSLLVKQLSNVKIRIINNPVKLVTLENDSASDAMKTVLEKKLGTPKSIISYYSISWATPNGGSVTLNKHPGSKPVFIANFKARQWLRDNVEPLKSELKGEMTSGDSLTPKKQRTEK
jgi:hypothetical protein